LLSKYMSNLEVLRASTSIASECLDVKAGYIREGYRTDLIVLKDDPTKDIENLKPTNVSYIIKDGRLYTGYGLYQE